MGWALLGIGLLLALCALLRRGLRRAPPPRALPELRGRTAIVTGERRERPRYPAPVQAGPGTARPRRSPLLRSAPQGEAAASGRPRRWSWLAAGPVWCWRPAAARGGRRPPAASAWRQATRRCGSCSWTWPACAQCEPLPVPSCARSPTCTSSSTTRVNHLGHFLLTQLLLERLRSCAPSRVVIVASSAHCAGRLHPDTLGRPPPGLLSTFQDYCDSKLANVLHTRELATRLHGTQVTCYAVHPGFVNMELFRHAPLWLKPLLVPLAWLFFLNAAEGAQTSLHCATCEGLERFSGRYFAHCRPQEPWPPARDDHLALALWEASERLVGLRGDRGSPSPAATVAGQ
ncbi:dehydrogenase/reductase SDR family member 13 isoform 3-T3 [Porphyrio hochstetteri]